MHQLPAFPKRLLAVFVSLCVFCSGLLAQNVSRVEYYIDTDPGFGKGTAVSITAGQDVTASFAINVNSLSTGFHNVYTRAFVKFYQVQENGKPVTNGGWSLTGVRTFYKENFTATTATLPTIVKGEYFADTDPGFGKGTNIPLTPGTNLANLSLAFDVTSLGAGFHQLYVRFKDTAGNWGQTSQRTFYKESLTINPTSLPNIVKGEYFLDTDPGFGKGKNIPVSPSSNLSNVTFAVDLTAISAGFHQLYIRFRDAAGNWSLSPVRTFYKEDLSQGNTTLPNIVKGEYFLDTDPGFGKGTNIPVTAGTNLSNVSFVADIASISNGFHQLYTRFRDATGKWSLTTNRAFYKESVSLAEPLSKITKVEYFVDTDPGFGKGKSVPVTAAVDLSNVIFEIDATSLALGDHTLYVRAQNAKGTWSITNQNAFRVEPPSGVFVTVGQIDQTLCIGSPLAVPFTTNSPFSAGNVFTAQLSDANGSFTNPTSIGTLTGTGSGTIRATVPNTTTGSNYRVRVVGSNPQQNSLANTTPLTINPVPPVFSIRGDTVVCTGTQTYALINYESDLKKYNWTLSGGGSLSVTNATASINWTTPGRYDIKVKYMGVCAGTDSVKVLNVNVINSGLTGTFSGMLPADGNTNLTLPVTFSWLPIANATAYDLYIWPAADTRPATPTVANLTGINYTVYSSTILQYEKNYNWQLVAKRACYTLSSPVQTFRLRYLPDVVVSSITPASTGFSGQSFSVNWQVKNIGQGSTLQERWSDDVYLSTDALFDPATDIYLGTLPNASELQPNASYSQTATFTLPQGINNTYYVFVITNVYNSLYESDRTNNTGISSTTSTIQLTPPPDLRVTSIVPPNFVFSGQNMDLSWKVSNLGPGSTRVANWTDDIYLSKDSVLNFSKATYLGNAGHIGVLEAGGIYSVTKTVKLPENTFGKHYIFVRTDVGNTVYEHAFESNNTSRSDSVSIILTPPIDLATTQLTVAPLAVSNRETIQVQWQVANVGGSPTETRVWDDHIYLSKDSTFKASSAIFLASIPRPNALKPEGTYQGQRTLSVPDNLSGTYFVYVFADATRLVYEYDLEANNIRRSSKALTIASPDLIVSNVVVPAQDTSGRPLEVKWAIKNNAAGTLVSTSLTDRISLSPTPVYNASTALELQTITYTTGNLAGGATLNKSATVTLPDTLSGNYYVFVQTDFPNAIYEAGQDTNNTARSAQPVRIYLRTWPDLQVSEVTVTTDPLLAGSVVPATFTVVNKGDGPISSGSWVDKLYLSTEAQFDVSKAVLVKEIIQSKVLPKGASYTVNTTIGISTQLNTGVYYLYVVTDANKAVDENANEANNTGKSKALNVRQYPPVDLAVTSVSSPGASSAGNTLTVAWSARNNGTAPTLQTQWGDALYLSRDTVWTKTDDVLMKEYVHDGALAVNQSYSNQQTAYLPDGISGVFYVLVVADHNDFNKDSNRRNNARLVTRGNGGEPVKVDIKYRAPSDLRISSFTAPSQGQAGQPMTVKWKVKNAGAGTTALKSWTDRVYLSPTTNVDDAVAVLGNYVRNDSLKSGQEYGDSLRVSLPSSVQGSFYVLIKTDANDNVYEYLAEDNNTGSSVITIAKAPVSDLVVSSVTIPGSAVVGETISIQWKLKNIGQFGAIGYLKDAVYLSEDAVRDANDLLLTTKETNINLDPQQELTQTFTGELKGAALKNYRVIVYTDVLNTINESDNTNNSRTSTGTVAVTVPELPLNVPTRRTLANTQELYYRIEVPASLAGETLLVTLRGDSTSGANELYLRHNQVPTRAVYDFAYGTPYAGNQEIIVPALKQGTYYLLATGFTTAGNTQAINLLAKRLDFEIRSVNASKGGNTGSVTVLLSGSKLSNVTAVSLRSGSRTIAARTIRIADPTRVYATFDLQGAALGPYDVIATNSAGATATLSKGFEVVAGVVENLVTNVVTPPNTRPSNVISLTVEYTNAGNTDIVNPVLRLSSLAGAPIGFNVADLGSNTKELTLDLKELNGPDKVLRPGASGTIVVYAKALTALGFLLIPAN